MSEVLIELSNNWKYGIIWDNDPTSQKYGCIIKLVDLEKGIEIR